MPLSGVWALGEAGTEGQAWGLAGVGLRLARLGCPPGLVISLALASWAGDWEAGASVSPFGKRGPHTRVCMSPGRWQPSFRSRVCCCCCRPWAGSGLWSPCRRRCRHTPFCGVGVSGSPCFFVSLCLSFIQLVGPRVLPSFDCSEKSNRTHGVW